MKCYKELVATEKAKEPVPIKLKRMLLRYQSLDPEHAKLFAERDYRKYLEMK